MKANIVLSFTAALALSACIPDPRRLETPPVQLKTPKGVVTCQLYTKELVLWDRSIDRPASMGLREADDLCHQEGLRQKNS